MERLTISGGRIGFYSEVINKCSNAKLPNIKEQFDAGKKAYEVDGYEYKEYTTDELKAIYTKLAELEDGLESGRVKELKFNIDDTVWIVTKQFNGFEIFSSIIEEIIITRSKTFLRCALCGNYQKFPEDLCFKTREEAAAHREELEKEYGIYE